MLTPFSSNVYADYMNARLARILYSAHIQYGMKVLDEKPVDPFQVNVIRIGDEIFVSSNHYRKYIRMKNTFWDNLTGNSWEARVRRAKKEAFEAAYEAHKENERSEYQVNKFQ